MPDGECEDMGAVNLFVLRLLGTGIAPAPNPFLIAGDDTAAQNSLDLSEAIIPKAIFTLAKSGITPPLTLVTPVALQRIRSGLGTKLVKVTTELKDSVHLLDISLFPDERTLDQADWTTSYNSFLKFIELGYRPTQYMGFVLHFKAMISNSEFKTWFTAFWDFDCRICSQFFTRPFIIDATGEAYGKLLQAARNRSLLETMASPRLSAPSSSTSSVGPSRSDKPCPRIQPYAGQQKKNSFQGNLLCLHCGGSTATRPLGADCTEARPNRHGRQFIIYANKDGLFRIGSDTPVCFTYNLGSECKYTDGTVRV
ncbi:hypothetical protein B0H17DRAFT_1197848 [Mycena rosella]|uniref:Uncharacterized protein n=1 Tax=Mycena rosella TaxID=1033263 RepID=A0AAD7GNZ9_MYCRO|nr:hypothetical protein B0H17DRAFT_1197848 [Mycena rosella]